MSVPELIAATRELAQTIDRLAFSAPVSHVYNPLVYALQPHIDYLTRYAAAPKRVIFLGMNPGPFGMVQTGIPFGEISVVRGWLGISGPVEKPAQENPKRPIEGFACTRSEVSGQRLWGLFKDECKTADAFFTDHFVANYCPLAFFDGSRNLTPDKLPKAETEPLYAACNVFLRRLAEILQPEWIIGVGNFAQAQAAEALATLAGKNIKIGRILHPSPASPAANRGFAAAARKQLVEQGIWRE